MMPKTFERVVPPLSCTSFENDVLLEGRIGKKPFSTW
jgi:hypothetical protein